MHEREAAMMPFAFEAIRDLGRAKHQDIARTIARNPEVKQRLGAAHAIDLLASDTFHATLTRALTVLQLASYILRDGDTWFVTPHGQRDQGALTTQAQAERLIRELEADLGAPLDALAREQGEASAAPAPQRAALKLSGVIWAHNTVLYGAPGTVTTDVTIRQAVALADHGRLAREDEGRDKARFDELRAQGRVGFVTFHPSYGYEDLVEGLRAEATPTGQLRYTMRHGPLRKIVAAAMAALAAAPRLARRRPFAEVWEALMTQGVHEEPSSDYKATVTPARTLLIEERAPSAGAPDRFEASREVVAKIYAMGAPRPQDQTYQELMSAILAGELPARKVAAAQEVWRQLDVYARGGEPMVDVLRVPHYVLVIDEIHRGDMARIFGELISLLEPSKRLGLSDAREVELASSGDTFGVPPNLHILGTMITTGQGIAQLDVALRRRFKLVELRPDPSRVQYGPAREVMEALNARLELLLDREHQLGHALFTGLREEWELVEVLRRDVLPLLREYFHGDWARIAAALGCANAGEGDEGALVYSLKVPRGALPPELVPTEQVVVWRERVEGLDGPGVIARAIKGG
jgi:5-methylcytosine-specific restriction enzyme B